MTQANTKNQAKTFRIQVSLDKATELEIHWPHKYRTAILATQGLNDVAIALIKIGVTNFNLKVVNEKTEMFENELFDTIGLY